MPADAGHRTTNEIDAGDLQNKMCSRLFEPLASQTVVRQGARDPHPEVGPVVPYKQVNQLMDDDVVDQSRFDLHRPPVEAKDAIRATASPALALTADQHLRGLIPKLRRPVADTVGQPYHRTLFVPSFQRSCHRQPALFSCQIARDRNPEAPMGKADSNPSDSRGLDEKPHLPAKVRKRLAADQLLWRRLQGLAARSSDNPSSPLLHYISNCLMVRVDRGSNQNSLLVIERDFDRFPAASTAEHTVIDPGIAKEDETLLGHQANLLRATSTMLLAISSNSSSERSPAARSSRLMSRRIARCTSSRRCQSTIA